MQDPPMPLHKNQKASMSKSTMSQNEKDLTTKPSLEKDITREPQWIWMPKLEVKKLQQKVSSTKKVVRQDQQWAKTSRSQSSTSSTRFVPKQLVEAQKGQACVWVLKVKTWNLKSKAPQNKTMKKKGRNQRRKPHQRSLPFITQRWIPKKVLNAQEGYNQIWVPRIHLSQDSAFDQRIQPPTKPTYRWIPKLINQPKVSNTKTLMPTNPTAKCSTNAISICWINNLTKNQTTIGLHILLSLK